MSRKIKRTKYNKRTKRNYSTRKNNKKYGGASYTPRTDTTINANSLDPTTRPTIAPRADADINVRSSVLAQQSKYTAAFKPNFKVTPNAQARNTARGSAGRSSARTRGGGRRRRRRHNK